MSRWENRSDYVEISARFDVLVTLIAVSICRARTFSFCIRTKQLPLDVKALFGGCHPSIGHGIRVCKILRSEWHRQERMYQDALHVQLQLTDLTPGVKKRRWREYCDRIEYTANHLWSRELASLRAQCPTKPRQSGVVHSCSDVVLPDYVHNTLALGPKFAVDRGRSAPELLSMVRSVAGLASPEDSDRCISEGVDVLQRGKPTSNSLPVRKTTKFLRDNELCVVPSDKEGGFAVLPNCLYLEKAVTAIESVFKCCTDIRLDRQRENDLILSAIARMTTERNSARTALMDVVLLVKEKNFRNVLGCSQHPDALTTELTKFYVLTMLHLGLNKSRHEWRKKKLHAKINRSS
ncbi:hypothetical protein HPB51_024905 [Rhipicephalus microplus]|uniref:Uncharacterized protein n=1 Tax=Rhipicephalus microplus TaxID=6941 RepID=A0A9J6DXL4_RHIMP|nr:hypothetical protein HPB51_024905 [Rhipicephalus microplus]